MARKPVPQYEMCARFKEAWEKERGGRYFISTLDLKEAYEFYVANGELSSDDMAPYIRNYLASEFPGWEKMGFPAWQFFKHFMSFAPKVEKEVVRRSTRYCGECKTYHSINTPCPPHRDVGNLIGTITKAG